jgi:amino acid transporter
MREMNHDEKAAVPAFESPETGAETKSVDRSAGEVNLTQDHQLQRGLKSRHIQFLALGGA